MSNTAPKMAISARAQRALTFGCINLPRDTTAATAMRVKPSKTRWAELTKAFDRALDQVAQKDDASKLMNKAMKLHAILFKDYCDNLPHPTHYTNEQLYDNFIVSLKSVSKE